MRCRLTLPPLYPAGGLPSLPPADPAFSLLCCPHPPDPLPLRGRGRPRLFYARGFAPCIPGLDPGRHWGRGANHAPGGWLARLGSDYPCCVISRDPAYPAAYCPQRFRTRWSDHGSTRALRHRPACRPAGSDCRTSPARCRRFSAEAQDPSQSP